MHLQYSLMSTKSDDLLFQVRIPCKTAICHHNLLAVTRSYTTERHRKSHVLTARTFLDFLT